jgi:hypothetical protein
VQAARQHEMTFAQGAGGAEFVEDLFGIHGALLARPD